MRRALTPCAAMLVLLAGCFLLHDGPSSGEDAGTAADWGVPDEPAPCAPGDACDCRAVGRVPAGEHLVGADMSWVRTEFPAPPYIDGPAHTVTLTRDVWLGLYEATAGCYGRCVRSGGCDAGEMRDEYLEGDVPEPGYWRDPDQALLPLVYMTYDGAGQYCGWLGGRLPTNAEWEKAARGPNGRLWPWAEDPPPEERGVVTEEQYLEIDRQRRYGDLPLYRQGPISEPLVIPVASFPEGRGPYGHFDLAGNAEEWVHDWLAPYGSEPLVDPQGPPEAHPDYPNRRTVRGAGDEAVWFRYHQVPSPEDGRWAPGFPGPRCAFDAPPDPLPMWETMDIASR